MNSGKTDVVIFTRRYTWSTNGILELKGQRLEISKHAKYLRAILDKKLTGKDHFENNCNKFIATLWLCRKAIGTAVDLHSDSTTQDNLCIDSLVKHSQAEDGYGQCGKAQRADP